VMPCAVEDRETKRLEQIARRVNAGGYFNP
jgi:hypothetical protein